MTAEEDDSASVKYVDLGIDETPITGATMPDRRYDETAYYDFEKNYANAVDLTRRVFGHDRADKLLAAKGQSKRTDFMTAMTWGWWLHRPVMEMADRVICILGALAPKAMEKGLRDYLQLGLAIGLHREKLREA
ncbi:MAG TPA: hypothetical protein VJB57_11750, partial [Dehalococcoidia bacterium]|nr:hypothetical protein [Dehalococcoidia bacterium]